MGHGGDHADSAQGDDHEQARQDASDEHVLDVDLGDHAVEDDRQAGWEQQSDTSRTRDQSGGKVRCIAAAFDQHVDQQGSEGQNGDSGCAGEGGKKCADQNGHDDQAAGKPAQPGPKQPHQTLSRLALREDKPGEGEQRDRRDAVAGEHGVGFAGNHFQRSEGTHEQQIGDSAQHDEYGSTEEDGSDQDADPHKGDSFSDTEKHLLEGAEYHRNLGQKGIEDVHHRAETDDRSQDTSQGGDAPLYSSNGGTSHKAYGDEQEPQRDDGYGELNGNKGDFFGWIETDQHQREGAPGHGRRNRGGDERGDSDDPAAHPFTNHLQTRRQGDMLALAGGNGSAQTGQPEYQMVGQIRGAVDSGFKEQSGDDFHRRQNCDQQQDDPCDPVFDTEEPAHCSVFPQVLSFF